jgi:hypothetical protein
MTIIHTVEDSKFSTVFLFDDMADSWDNSCEVIVGVFI